MLSLVEVDDVGNELLCIGVILIWQVWIDLSRSFFFALTFSSWRALPPFFRRLSCSLRGFLLFLSLFLLFLFLKAFLLFFINLFFFFAGFGFGLDELGELLDALEVRAEPIFYTDFHLGVLEPSQQFLIAKYITLRKGIFYICQKWMILGHFHEPISKHGLIEEVFRALDIISILVFQKT